MTSGPSLVVERCRRLAEHPAFQHAVLGLIVANAVLMGLETWPSVAARWGAVLGGLNVAIQIVFVVELVVRIAGHGSRPLQFFRSGWNAFDFTVVALSLLPVAGPFATVARLARVLRVARLISGMPELRLIIGTMLRSIPSMGNVVMLLGLLVYVYGVAGYHLFGRVDPEHWGTLGRAVETLFLVITLEGWVEIMRASEAATSWALVYYATFIIIAVFVVMNLFIAVVINNLEKARREELDEPPAQPDDAVHSELRAVRLQLAKLSETIDALRERRS
jgi:voltage-gated sodium channel